ncbi:MAG TPA: hypothetical protein DD490_34700, partial [Acidobacteria bacterium]|nr:hypothetical protein [Acidobacteriota bacterium]
GRRRRRLLAAAVAAAFVLGGVRYVVDLRAERHAALEARNDARQEAERADAVARFLKELFQASDPRQARGRIPDAKELLQRGSERLGRELRDQPVLRAQLLDTLGTIQTNLGLFDAARPLLEEALALRERHRGGGHPEVAETLVHLGALAQLSGKGDALPLLRRALAIREALGREDAGLADVLNDLGMTLATQGRFDEAETNLRRSLGLHERLWGERDPRVAKILHNLGGIALQSGRTEEAARLLEHAVAIREAAVPDDDPGLAGSREALALVRMQQGKPAEAVRTLEHL